MSKINIDEIVIPQNRVREFNPDKIDELKDSIKEIGLLQPIIVNNQNILIAGLHRLEACKALGWTEIDCIVKDLQELDAELAEIDENLIRSELTTLERFELLKRRKEIYEAKYPQTKAATGVELANKRWNKSDAGDTVSPASFNEDTAKKTNVSPRTIKRGVQIATNIDDEVKAIIKNTDIANSTRNLVSLARLEPEKQKKVAEKIKNENIDNVEKAIALIKKEEFMQNIEQQKQEIESNNLKAPDGLFEVVVIDPPWPYGTKYDPAGRRSANPYPEMSINELKELKLPAAENSTLFLWTTHKFIRNAFELLDVWGFEYRNALVWDKQKMGLGNLFRLQCEFCLVGFKGKPLLVNDGTFRDIISETRREHSRKPDSFYEMVDKLCVGRKLDYFSRQKRDGWETYGNDTEKFESKNENNIFLF